MGSYNRKSFVVFAAILMSVNNALGAIFLPYFIKQKLSVTATQLGTLALISAMIYIFVALKIKLARRRWGLRNSLVFSLILQLTGFCLVLVSNTLSFLVLPFIFIGAAQGSWWPLLEGAMCENQTSAQKKRAVAFFNMSWLFGLIIGPIISGFLYESEPMLPMYLGLGIILFLLVLVFIPKSLQIANWSTMANHPEESTRALPFFLRAGLLINLLSYLFIGCFRTILVEFTNPLGIDSSNYGIIQASFNFGMMISMIFLMKFHFWHFSKKTLFGFFILYAGTLLVFPLANQFYLLVSLSILLGLPSALFYFSSIYYGMLNAQEGTEHGGRHEAIIGFGQSLGPILGGVLIDFTKNPAAFFYMIGILALISTILIFFRAPGKEHKAIVMKP